MKNKTIRRVLESFAIIISVILFALSFLIVGKIIPVEWVKENAEKSYLKYEKEGKYLTSTSEVFFDNYTDAYFINGAVTSVEENVLVEALANHFTESENYNPDNEPPIKGIHYASTDVVSDDDGAKIIIWNYDRYWAGLTVVIKILLIFFSLAEIRDILIFVIISLSITVHLYPKILYQKNKKNYISS